MTKYGQRPPQVIAAHGDILVDAISDKREQIMTGLG
jgi:hypothetical protein